MANNIRLPGEGVLWFFYYYAEISGNYHSYNLLIYNHNMNGYLPRFISWLSFFFSKCGFHL